MSYSPAPERYDNDQFYARCGRSGLKLPKVSMGLWHNFGDGANHEATRELIFHCFDRGITHFDLANNYGPPAGAAERRFGEMLSGELKAFRDELVISTKAGYWMWNGPYGDLGSRKYLISSLDQSLKRLGLDYVDIFYHHRPDPDTPLEETMGALASIVNQGKALYVGLSNYGAERTKEAVSILKDMGIRCLIHQPRYSMIDRWVEDGLLDTLGNEGVGCIPFSPLGQGMLTGRYLNGIPEDSRAARPEGFLQKSDITETRVKKLRELNNVAILRGQTLAQMALSWVLRHKEVTSVLIGASRKEQVDDNLGALAAPPFSIEELDRIDEVLKDW